MRKDFTAENAATVMATFCEIDLLDPNKRFTKKYRQIPCEHTARQKVLSLGGAVRTAQMRGTKTAKSPVVFVCARLLPFRMLARYWRER
jgi:hypothetical protein